MRQVAACSLVHSWAASSSTRGMAKFLETLDRRHLPSLYCLKSMDVNFAINPGLPKYKRHTFEQFSVPNSSGRLRVSYLLDTSMLSLGYQLVIRELSEVYQ